MNSATRIKISMILVVFLAGLFSVCEAKASKFAGRKNVPTSGYTEVAPGQFMQTRNYVSYHSAQGGYPTRITLSL